jgi:hypothetical protein
MGYLATDLLRIKAQGFDWYVLLVEDNYYDQRRSELSRNFEAFARDLGRDALAVRGVDRDAFRDQVLDIYHVRRTGCRLPALLITDTLPRRTPDNEERMRHARVVLLSLPSRDWKPGDTSELLQAVARGVGDPEAFNALQQLDPSRFRSKWGWLTRYFDLKPNFMGFGVDVDQILEEMFNDKQST